ncbi:MAG TPA: response regulator [Verrucomicrobiae bacterium]|nr:response regulator [Verrucomicrobiae bacterium]
MSKTIKVLILEDRVKDAEMVVRELQRAGFDPQWTRVQTEADFLTELDKSPDIILSDYCMPQFNGLEAARLLRERGLNIPFILISGTVGEDVAVEAMKHGANDYLLKDRIARLGPAVEQALEQKRLRDERERAEEEIKKQLQELQAWHDAMLDREDRIIELKREVNEVQARHSQPPRYAGLETP